MTLFLRTKEPNLMYQHCINEIKIKNHELPLYCTFTHDPVFDSTPSLTYQFFDNWGGSET